LFQAEDGCVQKLQLLTQLVEQLGYIHFLLKSIVRSMTEENQTSPILVGKAPVFQAKEISGLVLFSSIGSTADR
jgi:hypothetical protein